MHQSELEHGVAEQSHGNATGHIENVVVRCIDGGEPDAEADHGPGHAHPHGAPGAHRVDECHEHVGRVERRHGREDVGVAGIETVEDAEARKGVEAATSPGVPSIIPNPCDATYHGGAAGWM